MDVVDQNIEAAKLRNDLIDQPVNLFTLGNVADKRHAFAPGLFYLLKRVRAFLQGATRYRDGRTVGRESQGNATTDTLTSPRYNRGFSVKPGHILC
jgi:hypothetical protein